ncbi:MAG: hypothetical protein ACXVCP_06180 [Bdellovibrio sp.]
MKELIKKHKFLLILVSFLHFSIGCANQQEFDPNNSETNFLNEPSSTQINNSNSQNSLVANFNLKEEVEYYKTRYNLDTLTEKLTDNKGKGAIEFYGTRNFRVVLPGILYRGGANNKYFNPPRSNTNPLPTKGLENLCKENFSTAVYLYSENFSTAPKNVNCKSVFQQDNNIQYKQYAADGENAKIIDLVYKRIKGLLPGPIYAHCWNGWHSSGLISGMVLKQFCDFTDAQADRYWVANTDGNYKGFNTIRTKLRNFKPYAKYSITEEEKALICPAPM